jgi:hypothetical protein
MIKRHIYLDIIFFFSFLAKFVILCENLPSLNGNSILKNETVKFVDYEFSIPYPSGIIVDKVETDNKTYRIARLQQNAVRLRPAWSEVYLLEKVFGYFECKILIETANKHANEFGWSKGRHIDYGIRPTDDLPLNKILSQNKYEILIDKIYNRIFPGIIKSYNLHPYELKVSDLFITRYDSNSTLKNYLAAHKDQYPWSFVINLNDNFDGGGTYFYETKKLWRAPMGSALYFSGYNLHGGNE